MRTLLKTLVLFSLFWFLLPVLGLLVDMSCRNCHAAQSPSNVPDEPRKYLLERIDDVAVVQLYVEGFEQLSVREKILVYHLSEAAIAGREVHISYPMDIDTQMLDWSGRAHAERLKD